MTAKVEKAEATLIETVCARVRERVDSEQAPRIEGFVPQYYGWVPAEDLAERSRRRRPQAEGTTSEGGRRCS